MEMDFLEFTSHLDSGLSFKKEKITYDSVEKKFKSVITDILSSKFTNGEKRRTNFFSQRINFSCPYCGDSNSDSSMKRGNIYKNSLQYVCFNCGEKKSLISFLRDFNKDSEFEYEELEFIKTILAESTQHNTARSATKIFSLIHEMEKYCFKKDTIMGYYGHLPITNNKRAYDYVFKERKQDPKDVNKFGYSPKDDAIVVYNTSNSGQEIIAFQMRYFKPKFNKQRFDTFDYHRIYREVFGAEFEDENTKAKLTRISNLYDIFHVNFSDNIFIFEGAFDSNLVNNSIATWSAGNKVYFPSGLYLYDNTKIDQRGMQESLVMLQAKYYVFLWGMYLDENPQYAHCKDLNDIYKKSLNPPKEKDLLKYFSKDPLDIIFL